ncbi:MAG: hypothetical protein WCW01_00670 [Gammaproteobacteria bacterium]
MKKQSPMDISKIEAFVAKAQNLKKQNKLDLSSDQDLSIALMNLISIEEHFFFSGAKTGNTKYYDLLSEIRAMRKDLLKKLVPEYTDGSERWCISKHLLAASMRLMEVGTKQLDLGNKETAYDFFHKAYDLHSLFWGINLNLVDLNQVKNIDSEALNIGDSEKQSLRGTLSKIMHKLIDCCLE